MNGRWNITFCIVCCLIGFFIKIKDNIEYYLYAQTDSL